MSQGQLFDAGRVRVYAGSRHRLRDARLVASGENRRRMRERTAAQRGMTLQEYEAQMRVPVDRDERLRQRAASAATARYRHTNKLRRAVVMTPEERRRVTNKAAMEKYYANPETWYRAAYKRRALKNAAAHEHVSRREVFDHDNWRCRVCGKRVRDDVKRGHPRKAIMAHIVALAAGGPHTRDNLCTLCHECNTRDGVNQVPIQTALVLPADG